MENEIKEAYDTLNNYLQIVPEMFVSVDQGQFSKLQTKYRHLLLRYSNDYRTLTSLKHIEKSIPEIILSNPKVVAELNGIDQIKRKLEIEKQKYEQLTNHARNQEFEKNRLLQNLKNKKKQLILQKRKYMKLRREIDLESIQQKPKTFRKYIFKSQSGSEKPVQQIAKKQLDQLQLLMTFKRGIKHIERKQFQTNQRNVSLVLQNLKIKKNISTIFQKKRFRDQQQMAKSWERRLVSTKASQRNSDPNSIFRHSGWNIFQTERDHSSQLQSLSSLELYSKICQNKLKLSVFTSTLNDLLCKHQ